MDDAVWNHAVFSKKRDRLLTSDVARHFFAEVNKQGKRFMSDERFTVDGTLIQAGVPADRSSSVGWRPGRRTRVSAGRTIAPCDPSRSLFASHPGRPQPLRAKRRIELILSIRVGILSLVAAMDLIGTLLRCLPDGGYTMHGGRFVHGGCFVWRSQPIFKEGTLPLATLLDVDNSGLRTKK